MAISVRVKRDGGGGRVHQFVPRPVVASRRPCNRYYKKHARSLTKKLYDVTLGNLLGYNKKFYRTILTYQQLVKVKQTVSLHPVQNAAIFALRPVRRRTALISPPEGLTHAQATTHTTG